VISNFHNYMTLLIVEYMPPINEPEDPHSPISEQPSEENQTFESQSQTKQRSNPEELISEDHQFSQSNPKNYEEPQTDMMSSGAYECPQASSADDEQQNKLLHSPIYDEPLFSFLKSRNHDERKTSLESHTYDEIGKFLQSLTSSSTQQETHSLEPMAYENPLAFNFRSEFSKEDDFTYHQTNLPPFNSKKSNKFKSQSCEELQLCSRQPRVNPLTDIPSEPVPYAAISYCGTLPTTRQRSLSRELLLPENTGYSTLGYPLRPQPYEVSEEMLVVGLTSSNHDMSVIYIRYH